MLARGGGTLQPRIAEVLIVTEDAVEKPVRSILRKLSIPPAAGDHRRLLAVLSFLRGTPSA